MTLQKYFIHQQRATIFSLESYPVDNWHIHEFYTTVIKTNRTKQSFASKVPDFTKRNTWVVTLRLRQLFRVWNHWIEVEVLPRTRGENFSEEGNFKILSVFLFFAITGEARVRIDIESYSVLIVRLMKNAFILHVVLTSKLCWEYERRSTLAFETLHFYNLGRRNESASLSACFP